MRVALVHDYFTQLGGAERVVARMAGLYPDADVWASVVDRRLLPCVAPRSARPLLRAPAILDARPAAGRARPVPARRLRHGSRSTGRTVVLTSTSAFAHHVRVPAGAVHVAYVHTPPRFLWSPAVYFERERWRGAALAPALAWLRRGDRAAVARIDVLVANSAWTAERIRAVHGRTSTVLHPPVETGRFRPSDERSGRFLIVARLRPYKRIDVAIGAANRLGVGLDIIGSGPDLARLRRRAGPTVRFLGRLDDAAVSRAMASCAGLVVPGAEDFGLTLAEVQAAGRPPIASRPGGPSRSWMTARPGS